MNKIQRKRLEKLATILDTADAEHRDKGEPKYKQDTFVHTCGTPACALGHWAANNRRRWTFELGYFPELKHRELMPTGSSVVEFGISSDESDDLFGETGCGGARTAKQAARYIRKFLARKDKETRK